MAKDKHILNFLKKHPHWDEAHRIFVCLVERGYCVYWAGGCVRDAILRRMPKDLDLATDVDPDEVLNLFPGSLDVGKSFGVVIIPLKGGGQVEVARFRSDGHYLDGRHPEGISYSSPREDALRRDFTINSLFFDGERLVDFVGGLEDLNKGIIRCVGDPYSRFSEDYLRILRAIRFSVELDFYIDSQAMQAMSQLGSNIQKISIERVVVELDKMMSGSRNYEALNLIKKTNLSIHIFGPLGELLEGSDCVKVKFICSRCSEKSLRLLFVSLLLFYEKALDVSFDRKTYLSHFKISNSLKKEILHFVAAIHDLTQGKDWLKALKILKGEGGEIILELCHLLLKINQQSDEILLKHIVKLNSLGGVLPEPLVDGDDILTLGFSGPLVGEALDFSYRTQINYPKFSKEKILKLCVKEFNKSFESPSENALGSTRI